MRKASLVLAMLAVVGLALPTWAGQVTAVQSGDWEDPATWGLENRCPQFFDDVVIPEGVTVTINAPFPVPPEIAARPGCATGLIGIASLRVDGTLTSPEGIDIVIVAHGTSQGTDLGPLAAGNDDIVVNGTIQGGRHVTLQAVQGNVVINGTVTPGPEGQVFLSGLNQAPGGGLPFMPNPKVYAINDVMPDADLFLQKVEELGGAPYGGTLTWSTFANPRSLNYVITRETSSNEVHDRMIQGILGGFAGEIPMDPGIAEAYWISEDGKALFIKFREGLTWSDGVAFSVERDVIRAYQWVHMDPVFLDQELARFLEFCTVGGEAPTIEQVDELTIKVTWPVKPTGLEDPNVSPFTCFASAEVGTPIPMHRLGPEVLLGVDVYDPATQAEAYAQAFADAWGVGTPPCPVGQERVEDPAQAPAAGEACIVSIGPYILSAPVQLDVGASFVRNPWFWAVDDLGNQLPYLDGMNLVIVENQDVELLKFLNGETDVLTPRSIDVAVIQERAAELNIRLTTATSVSGLGAGFLGFNQENPARPGLSLVFFTPEFRRAMSNLMDRDTMVASLNAGFGQPHFQPGVATQFMLSNEDPDLAPIVEELQFDPERAAQRLDRLGLVDRDGDGIRDIPAEWGIIVPGNDNVLQSEPAGDDFAQAEGPTLDGTGEVAIIYPGPNGVLDTQPAGDDIALVAGEADRLEFVLITNEGNTFRERTIKLFSDVAATVGVKVTPQPISFVALVRAVLTPESDAWEAVVVGITGDWRGPGVLDSCGFLHLGDLARSCDAAQGVTDDVRIPFQKWIDAQAPKFLESEDPVSRAERSRMWQLVNAKHAYLVYHIKGLGHGAVREDRVANTGNFPVGTFGPVNEEIVFRVDL